MLNIKKIDNHVILSYLSCKVLFTAEQYETLSENLFVEYGPNKREKIKVEDLIFSDLNLIYQKHIPNYCDEERRKLDMKHLLSVCSW